MQFRDTYDSPADIPHPDVKRIVTEHIAWMHFAAATSTTNNEEALRYFLTTHSFFGKTFSQLNETLDHLPSKVKIERLIHHFDILFFHGKLERYIRFDWTDLENRGSAFCRHWAEFGVLIDWVEINLNTSLTWTVWQIWTDLLHEMCHAFVNLYCCAYADVCLIHDCWRRTMIGRTGHGWMWQKLIKAVEECWRTMSGTAINLNRPDLAVLECTEEARTHAVAIRESLAECFQGHESSMIDAIIAEGRAKEIARNPEKFRARLRWRRVLRTISICIRAVRLFAPSASTTNR